MEGCERSSGGEEEEGGREGMMSSFNPIALPFPPSCFLHRIFFYLSSLSLSSRTIFSVVQLGVCARVCVCVGVLMQDV